MRKTLMTVITDVAPGRSDQLLGVLEKISADPAGNPLLPLATLPGLHFASLMVFDDETHGPKLLFEADVDGSARRWLATLVAEVPEGLEAVYRNCTGFPGAGGSAEVEAYLRARVVRPHAVRTRRMAPGLLKRRTVAYAGLVGDVTSSSRTRRASRRGATKV